MSNGCELQPERAHATCWDRRAHQPLWRVSDSRWGEFVSVMQKEKYYSLHSVTFKTTWPSPFGRTPCRDSSGAAGTKCYRLHATRPTRTAATLSVWGPRMQNKVPGSIKSGGTFRIIASSETGVELRLHRLTLPLWGAQPPLHCVGATTLFYLHPSHMTTSKAPSHFIINCLSSARLNEVQCVFVGMHFQALQNAYCNINL